MKIFPSIVLCFLCGDWQLVIVNISISVGSILVVAVAAWLDKLGLALERRLFVDVTSSPDDSTWTCGLLIFSKEVGLVFGSGLPSLTVGWIQLSPAAPRVALGSVGVVIDSKVLHCTSMSMPKCQPQCPSIGSVPQSVLGHHEGYPPFLAQDLFHEAAALVFHFASTLLNCRLTTWVTSYR